MMKYGEYLVQRSGYLNSSVTFMDSIEKQWIDTLYLKMKSKEPLDISDLNLWNYTRNFPVGRLDFTNEKNIYQSAGDVSGTQKITLPEIGCAGELAGQWYESDVKNLWHGSINSYVLFRIQVLNPVSREELCLFCKKNDGEIYQEFSIPEFFQSLQPASICASFDFSWVKPLIESHLFAWLNSFEEQMKVEFQKDVDRLNLYFSQLHQEISQKRKAMFHHNYFFEKEILLKEELESMAREIEEHESLLVRRYKTRFDAGILVYGSVS